jgi:hypothetical protein
MVGQKGREFATRQAGTKSGVNKGTKHGAGPSTPHKNPKVTAKRGGAKRMKGGY